MKRSRTAWGPYNLERARRGLMPQVPWLLNMIPMYLHKARPATAAVVIDWFNLAGTEDTSDETLSSLVEKYDLSVMAIQSRISRYLRYVCLTHGSTLSFVQKRNMQERWRNRQYVELTRAAMGERLFWEHVEKWGFKQQVVELLDLIWDDALGKYVALDAGESKSMRMIEERLMRKWNLEAEKRRGQINSGGGDGKDWEGVV